MGGLECQEKYAWSLRDSCRESINIYQAAGQGRRTKSQEKEEDRSAASSQSGSSSSADGGREQEDDEVAELLARRAPRHALACLAVIEDCTPTYFCASAAEGGAQ